MFLDRIVAAKQKELEELKEQFSLAKAEREIASMPPCRGFAKALGENRKRRMGLIAEVKKASPSKGIIREDFHPLEIAQSYVSAGTDCISVLTDEQFFQGSNQYLSQIRKTVDVPLLRKDFTLDFRQIYEARLIGADAVLLIAAILTPAQMKELMAISRDIGLDALVEVHHRAELEIALELDCDLIGINNRNLHTFVTDLKTTAELMPLIPRDKTVISESGISSPEQIEELSSMGVSAVLIGEHFMRQASPGQAIIDLLGE